MTIGTSRTRQPDGPPCRPAGSRAGNLSGKPDRCRGDSVEAQDLTTPEGEDPRHGTRLPGRRISHPSPRAGLLGHRYSAGHGLRLGTTSHPSTPLRPDAFITELSIQRYAVLGGSQRTSRTGAPEAVSSSAVICRPPRRGLPPPPNDRVGATGFGRGLAVRSPVRGARSRCAPVVAVVSPARPTRA